LHVAGVLSFSALFSVSDTMADLGGRRYTSSSFSKYNAYTIEIL